MILVDDMVNTGCTLVLAARTLHENGAKSVHAIISHGMSHVVLSPTTFISLTPRSSFGGQYELNRATTYRRVGGMYPRLVSTL